MQVISEKRHKRLRVDGSSARASIPSLSIALCPPELQPLQKALTGQPTNATYIIQGYVAEGLAARGHRLTFLVPRNLDEIVCADDLQRPTRAPRTWSASAWFDIVSKASWRVQQLLRVPYLNVFSNYRLYDACLQCLPGHDVVYERNGLYKYGVAKACKRLGLPYVLYFEADDILEHDIMGKPITGLRRWRAKQAIQYNLNAADCVLCVSEPARAQLVKTWGVPAEKIIVFANVADTHRFRPDPVARAEVRNSLGMNSQPMVIFVGNFYQWHDVSTLLDAFSQAREASPDARLVLVGDGATRQDMEERAADLGVCDAVQFTGLVAHDEIPRLMAAADVAVVPYPVMKQDLWLSPLKLFEYMATGSAIVASAVGQVAEVIKDDRNGLLVPPGDATSMAAALKRLINNPALRMQLGQQARDDAVQRHSWERYLSRLEQVFIAVINGQPFSHI